MHALAEVIFAIFITRDSRPIASAAFLAGISGSEYIARIQNISAFAMTEEFHFWRFRCQSIFFRRPRSALFSVRIILCGIERWVAQDAVIEVVIILCRVNRKFARVKKCIENRALFSVNFNVVGCNVVTWFEGIIIFLQKKRDNFVLWLCSGAKI